MSLPTNRMPGDIIQAVDINQIAEAVNQLSDSVTSEPGGTTDHAALTNRDAADQHPIGSVTGLQSALDGKAATGHGHTIEDVEYLQIALNNKAEAGHGHPIADVTGLQTALNGKAATGHTHDDRYYTESEVNSALSGKANTSHTHDDRYYTETEADDRFVRTVNGTGPDESGNVAVEGGGSAPRYGVARVNPTSLYSTYQASTLVPVGTTIAASTNVSAVGMVSVAPVTVTEVGVNITTAGVPGALVRFGIYADNAGKPGSLLWDSGDVPAETIGTTFVSVSGGLLLSGDLWTIGVYSGAVGMMAWDPTANERAAGTAGGSARVLTTDATTGAPLPATLHISGNNSSNGRAAALLVKA